MRLIFLGCGYLGYNLNIRLKEKYDAEMWGIDSPYVHLLDRFTEVDAFDPDALSKLDFRDAVLVDTVALVANNARTSDDEEALQEIERKYRALLNVLKEGGLKRFIYFSSGGTIYGDSEKAIAEDAPINPISLYARSKARVEKVIRESGVDYLILRLSNPFGGYQLTNKGQGVIPILINKALRDEVFEMWISGDSVRDYFYIDDLAKVIDGLIEHDISRETINVGSGVGTSLQEVIHGVEEAVGKTIRIERKSSDVHMVQSIILDTGKLFRLIGYVPDTSIEYGIREEVKRIMEENQ
ncbi:MAG: NAD-dependent epimerase/dehydratase family protein [Solobacterium sp.]|nr:NAD-dependent epimerase/dehydratase family protein [Solobacterium sp.]